jgi:hypothetical protein
MFNSTMRLLLTNCGPLGKTFRAAYCSVTFTMPFGLSVPDAVLNRAKFSPNCLPKRKLAAATFYGFLFLTLRLGRSIDNSFSKLREIELFAFEVCFQSLASWHGSKPIANFKMMHYRGD